MSAPQGRPVLTPEQAARIAKLLNLDAEIRAAGRNVA